MDFDLAPEIGVVLLAFAEVGVVVLGGVSPLGGVLLFSAADLWRGLLYLGWAADADAAGLVRAGAAEWEWVWVWWVWPFSADLEWEEVEVKVTRPGPFISMAFRAMFVRPEAE